MSMHTEPGGGESANAVRQDDLSCKISFPESTKSSPCRFVFGGRIKRPGTCGSLELGLVLGLELGLG